MNNTVTIVDYGIGNLYSVARAVERAGGEARIINNSHQIVSAERLLLPGVGAFASCATRLRCNGLSDAVTVFAATGRPFLGICVGMQLLFDYSLEFGRHLGLGLIPGRVELIPADDGSGLRKVPHIGWSSLRMPVGVSSWNGTLLENALSGEDVAYFVHSYNCIPANPSSLLAETDYDGFNITAAVKKDNITAFQCHPEKSGLLGLNIFQNFLRN